MLSTRRSAPLSAGLHAFATLCVLLLLGLALLAVALGFAADRPARTETAVRLSALGLTARNLRTVTVGELLPLVLAGSVGGVAVGVLMARTCLKLLDLRLITGQATTPALTLPWTVAVPVLALLPQIPLLVALDSRPARLR